MTDLEIVDDIRNVLEADSQRFLGTVVDKPKSFGGILARASDEIVRLREANEKLEATVLTYKTCPVSDYKKGERATFCVLAVGHSEPHDMKPWIGKKHPAAEVTP